MGQGAHKVPLLRAVLHCRFTTSLHHARLATKRIKLQCEYLRVMLRPRLVRVYAGGCSSPSSDLSPPSQLEPSALRMTLAGAFHIRTPSSQGGSLSHGPHACYREVSWA